MAHKQHFVVPAPEEICPAGAAWGSTNRWIEPWNDDAGKTELLLLLPVVVAAIVGHAVSWCTQFKRHSS
jgi:hypothetical protein